MPGNFWVLVGESGGRALRSIRYSRPHYLFDADLEGTRLAPGISRNSRRLLTLQHPDI